jgi:hypothetical protein
VKEKEQMQMERMLSSRYIEETTREKIYLNCTKEFASFFQPFEVTRYVYAPSAGSDASLFWSIDLQAEHYFPRAPEYIPVKSTAVPLSEVSVSQNARVKATNGTVGRLRGFLVNPFGWKITHLILQKGHIWNSEEVMISVSDIEGFEENIVQLKLDKKTIIALPSVPTRRLSQCNG